MTARDLLKKAAGAGAATLAACSPQSAQLSPRSPTTNADLKSGEAISSNEPEALITAETPTTLEATTTTLAVVLPTSPPTTLPIPDNSIARGPLPVDASLTPYEGWAIPKYIVGCETGGTFDWMAYNTSSGASGPYQLMPFHLGGDARMFPREVQHAKAAQLWDNGRGSSHWQACL